MINLEQVLKIKEKIKFLETPEDANGFDLVARVELEVGGLFLGANDITKEELNSLLSVITFEGEKPKNIEIYD